MSSAACGIEIIFAFLVDGVEDSGRELTEYDSQRKTCFTDQEMGAVRGDRILELMMVGASCLFILTC
jgi:hypothetical protein